MGSSLYLSWSLISLQAQETKKKPKGEAERHARACMHTHARDEKEVNSHAVPIQEMRLKRHGVQAKREEWEGPRPLVPVARPNPWEHMDHDPNCWINTS